MGQECPSPRSHQPPDPFPLYARGLRLPLTSLALGPRSPLLESQIKSLAPVLIPKRGCPGGQLGLVPPARQSGLGTAEVGDRGSQPGLVASHVTWKLF